ncbi:alpha-mannosyltransferase [Frigoriglobus tundricola]|uniref:Uncharacterized protein n=1 Tax=Frigoriglobus tundricola TaxID=2774151 RepID=A0A6M5Z227_9BACT|nr:hypothetical protein [Frigoriglobus tundricola]QJX00106.1 hypothetical protein FTUN_7730 [Frigoriglobus tundricola]
MSHHFPECRHRREPRARWSAMCRSPKVAGLRMVTPDVCRSCPFVDHHHPGDGTGADETVRPDMALEPLIELISGPARAWPPGWGDWDVTHRAHRVAADRFLAESQEYPAGRFCGRGIVIVGGGATYFASLYVTVRAIRHVGCRLPIQVWYLGREDELPAPRRAVLERYGVACVDADAVRARFPCRILNGWELKAFAVLHAGFEEVLSLDADCYPVRDPSYLFDEPGYRATGAVFWPDLPFGPTPDWAAFGVAPTGRRTLETGQFLLDKRRVWPALRLAWWYNDHSDWSYLHGYGDKSTFEVAWARCGLPHAMYTEAVKWESDCFHHIGPEGAVLFLHRCRDKFRLGEPAYMTPQNFTSNRFHPDLLMETECFGWLRELGRDLDPTGAGVAPSVPRIGALLYTCPDRRAVCEGTLGRWRGTDWGADPVVLIDTGTGPASTDRLAAHARHMLTRALETEADYYLLLEDDLIFNLHLRHNLTNWAPVRDRTLWAGSLFNPSLRVAGTNPSELWGARSCVCARGHFFGAQAIVVSRGAVVEALREWDATPGPYDLRLAAIVERHAPGVVIHSPSLVQHVGARSTWGGEPIRATNFDPFFRA